MNKRSNTWLCLVWWLYLVFTALLYCTMIQNIECEMSPRLTTPFPVNCEHFLVVMDVFIVWQMTLTTDGDYTSTLFFFFSPFSFYSAALSQASTAEQLTEKTEWALEGWCHVKYKTQPSKTSASHGLIRRDFTFLLLFISSTLSGSNSCECEAYILEGPML